MVRQGRDSAVKARAMVLKEACRLEPETFDIPPLREGQVLIRVRAAGVCGSDLHQWQGKDPRLPYPVILGHEGVGTVIDYRGQPATISGERLERGDTIIWNRGISCGRCFFCTVLHKPALCTDRKVYGINRSSLDPPYLNGCYSTHVILIPGTDIFKLFGSCPEVIVPVSCSGATMAHAFELAGPQQGSTVVIQGPGPLGAFGTAFARRAGAWRVVIIGGTGRRLEICRKFGAHRILNRLETTVESRREVVLEMTGGRGADLVVETAGATGALREGLDLVRSGGTYLSVGFAHPVPEVPLDPYRQLVRKNLRMQGVWVSDTGHMHQALNMVMDDTKLFENLITHRLPLRDAERSFDLLANKEAMKVILVPRERNED